MADQPKVEPVNTATSNKSSSNKTLIIILIVLACVALLCCIVPAIGLAVWGNYVDSNLNVNDVVLQEDNSVTDDDSDDDYDPNYDYAADLSCPGELILGEDIRNLNIEEGSTVSSPLLVTGEIRGGNCFEAYCPVYMYHEEHILGAGYLSLNGEWTTDEFVPFEGTIVFDNEHSSHMDLIVMNDNPSGLPENCKMFKLSIEQEQ